MASLRKIASILREDAQDGIAWFVVWKKGRSWNALEVWPEAMDSDGTTVTLKSDGGYRLSAATAAALMEIHPDTLLELLEDGVYTFGRVWKKRKSSKRTCWISRILFEQEMGIPVPVRRR